MIRRTSPRNFFLTAPFAFLTLASAAFAAPCDPPVPPVVLAQNGSGRSLEWDFPAGFPLQNVFPLNAEPEKSHLKWIRSRTTWSAVQNLRNGIAIRERAISSLSPGDSFRESLEADVRNARKIAEGRIGVIRPVHCLEGLAMREFLKIADLRGNPQEFLAVVFEKNGAFKMLGDFHRRPVGSVVGVNASPAITARTKRLRKQGWRYHAHLHNHPFNFDNAYGDIGGTLAPSEADIATYRSLKTERAWITNGLEMIEIKLAEFDLFD